MLETVHMITGASYEITSSGLKSSKRKSKDNCVYAGSQSKVDNTWINDIILPESEKGVGKRHFMIQHLRGQGYSDKGAYFIKDLGDGLGTFIKLSKPLKLISNFIVSFGDSHLVIKIEKKDLILRFIDGPRNDEKL